MEMNFCRRCGQPLQNYKKHIYHCRNGHVIYGNSSPSVGIFLVDSENNVLLSVRGIEPRKGKLDSFGGFLDTGETFEDALARELEEEVGLKPGQYTTPVYLTSGTGIYPYKDEDIPVVCNFYWAKVDNPTKLIALDDVAEILILKPHEIDENLFHDDDVRAGFYALKHLLAKNS